jgi:hypothetical protein
MMDGSNIDLSTTNCKAKHPEIGARCTLDPVHLDFGGEHMTRIANGLIFWKDENEQLPRTT